MSHTTNHYDLIVLGADVAGLVAAALVARRGKRVLVLPHGPVDGSYRVLGRSLALDTAPVVHGATPPVERVLHELGLAQQVRRQLAPVTDLVHHVGVDARLDLDPQAPNLATELLRVWPTDPTQAAWGLHQRWAEATDVLLDELLSSDSALSAEGFWGRRFLAKVASQLPERGLDDLEPLPRGHGFRTLVAAPSPWLAHLTPAQLSKAASLRLGRRWAQGPEELPGGERRVRELLIQRIELHSGEIKRELRVGELLVKRGRLVGVSLLGKRDRYGCDHLVVATDPGVLLEQNLLSEVLPKGLLHTLAGIAPRARRFVMHLEVEAPGVTQALGGMALCSPAAGEVGVHGEGHTYVRCEPSSSDPVRRIAICRIVGADQAVDRLREDILDELDERGVLPFARPYVRLCHSPHDGRDPTDGRGQSLEISGAVNPSRLPMAALYGSHGEPLLGVGLLPHSSGIRGLSFASRVNLPGLGLEGEFVSGIAVANTVANPARSPLSRSALLSKA